MKNNIKKIMLLIFLLGISFSAFSKPVDEDPIEREMLDIAAKLRCTVCQNQPVAESRSGLAGDMRNLITEKLKQGKNEKEIVQFFVDRYGDYVLLEPPQSGNGAVLWVLPPLLLLFAALAAVLMMKSRIKNQSTMPPPVLSDADRERIRLARGIDADEKNKSKEVK